MDSSRAWRSVSELESAAELDQRLAIVVALAVEDAVHPALNPTLKRFKKGGDQNDSDALAPVANRLGQAIVGEAGGARDYAEVTSQDEAGGQRVGHAALEDQIGVHQPVTDDGPTEGQRQKDDGEAGQIGEKPGQRQIEEEEDRVEGEWPHRQPCAAIEPLQLLALQGGVGERITANEEAGGQDVEDGIVAGGDLLKAVLEQTRGLPEVDGIEPQAQQHRAGRVDQRKQNATAEFLQAFLGEAESKVQKERRLQGFSQNVGPENDPVERVERAGVLERIEGEGDQAEEVEVGGARRCPATEENVDADGQVDKPDDALTQLQTAVERLRDHFDRPAQRSSVSHDPIVDLEVASGVIKGALQIIHALDGGVFDLGRRQGKRLFTRLLDGFVRQTP